MKLIDLLVEKLEEWPEGAVCGVQDSGGCVKLMPSMPVISKFVSSPESPDRSGDWWYILGDDVLCSASSTVAAIISPTICTDWQTAIVTREMWDEAKMVKSDKQWPSAGVTAIVDNSERWELSEHGESFVGKEVTVHTLFEDNFGVKMAAVSEDGGSCACFRVEMLRPLRTERERWIEKAQQALKDSHWEVFVDISVLGVIYDAGLAKEVE